MFATGQGRKFRNWYIFTKKWIVCFNYHNCKWGVFDKFRYLLLYIIDKVYKESKAVKLWLVLQGIRHKVIEITIMHWNIVILHSWQPTNTIIRSKLKQPATLVELESFFPVKSEKIKFSVFPLLFVFLTVILTSWSPVVATDRKPS